MNPISGYSPSPQMNTQRSGSFLVNGNFIANSNEAERNLARKLMNQIHKLPFLDTQKILGYVGQQRRHTIDILTREGEEPSIVFLRKGKLVGQTTFSGLDEYITNRYNGEIGPKSVFTDPESAPTENSFSVKSLFSRIFKLPPKENSSDLG